jgi:hypothetical protein
LLLVQQHLSDIVTYGGCNMTLGLFLVLVTFAGSVYLLYKNRGERRLAIGALVASSLSLLLQLNLIALNMHYVRTIIWTAIAVCAGLIWTRENTKMSSTVAAAVAFAAAIPAALSLQLLR